MGERGEVAGADGALGRHQRMEAGVQRGNPTSMKIILGLLKPRSGQVVFDGQPLTGLSTPQIVRRGIGSVPESRRLFGTLSGGEQQMVAMARTLMGRPRLIVMSEPTMGLSPLHVDRVLEMIQTINRQGVSIFMVEQNASLARDPQIRDAYLGGAQAA
ncbi:ATP-binding cassette domain-containing protein [Azospirillum endophyticum]|uniref:ATP-binding cassette domain-containing protein n=1 Tax=Azospirillum endophyticum TaxID=2800326 RepID=UPI001FFE6097